MAEQQTAQRFSHKQLWAAIPSGWKIALVVGSVYLTAIQAIVTVLALTGSEWPIEVRLGEVASKFIAVGAVLIAVVKGRQVTGVPIARNETFLLVLLVAGAVYGFVTPLLR